MRKALPCIDLEQFSFHVCHLISRKWHVTVLLCPKVAVFLLETTKTFLQDPNIKTSCVTEEKAEGAGLTSAAELTIRSAAETTS
jgi:hypothetical protein